MCVNVNQAKQQSLCLAYVLLIYLTSLVFYLSLYSLLGLLGLLDCKYNINTFPTLFSKMAS